MKCDHEYAYYERVPEGDDLVTIYKCKRCGLEAMGERYRGAAKEGKNEPRRHNQS